MRPYFAIIKDSFRAAWASRVLYVLLGLITLLLVALAPLHYRESLDWKLISTDYLREFGSISERLFDKKESDDDPLFGEIWNAFPQGLRKDITTTFEESSNKRNNPNMDIFHELIGELNNVIRKPGFFAQADLSQLGIDEDIKSARQNSDNVESQRRLNRLIIAKLFSPFIEAGDKSSMTAYYGPWRLGFLDSLSASKGQFTSGIAAYIPGILDKFVLSIGLAIAIVVTASIIPETFEPGSLNLLLSKPVSRWGLYIAKFVGGCVFIAICATYLFAGIWLWLGLGLGVWENVILLSIILYIIVFGIYFSVSAFVGLVFRSTILAIMVTLLFWSACFLVGTSYGFLDTRLQNTRIVKLVESDDTMLALDRMSQLTYWQPKSKQWVSAYPKNEDQQDQQDRQSVGAVSWLGDLEEFPLPFGPVVNPDDGRLVAGRTSMTNPLSFGQQELLASSPGGGAMQSKGNFPRGTIDFLQGAEDLIAVTGEGKFFRFGDKNESDTKPKTPKTRKTKPSNKLFVQLGPDKPSPVTSRGVCAINLKTSEIAVYGNRVVSVYRSTDEGYLLDRSIEVETDAPDSMSCQVAFAGDTIMLALGNGQIITLRGSDLKELFGYRPDIHHAIESVVASQDGRYFFVLYRQGTARMLDTQNPKAMSIAPFTGQGNISAVCVSRTGELLVADRGNRVTRYDAKDFEQIKTISPDDGTIEKIYYWGIQPLYSIWPKPGEFYKVVAWLANGDDGAPVNEVDLRLKPRYRSPWAPLTSGLAFMAVMLGLSCLYFWRKDY